MPCHTQKSLVITLFEETEIASSITWSSSWESCGYVNGKRVGVLTQDKRTFKFFYSFGAEFPGVLLSCYKTHCCATSREYYFVFPTRHWTYFIDELKPRVIEYQNSLQSTIVAINTNGKNERPDYFRDQIIVSNSIKVLNRKNSVNVI